MLRYYFIYCINLLIFNRPTAHKNAIITNKFRSIFTTLNCCKAVIESEKKSSIATKSEHRAGGKAVKESDIDSILGSFTRIEK